MSVGNIPYRYIPIDTDNYFDEQKQITEIVSHLVKENRYRVYCYWSCRQWECKHIPQCSSVEKCERRELRLVDECKHDLREQFRNRDRRHWNAIECVRYAKDHRISKPSCIHVPHCSNQNECERRLSGDECKHKPRCFDEIRCLELVRYKWQNKSRCDREWKVPYIQASLESYLEDTEMGLCYFVKYCDNKRHGHYLRNPMLVSSFFLYTSKNSSEKPDVEIVRHLVWNNRYRVFGNWKCLNCNKKWKSAYTWISLQKFIKKTRKRLNLRDYIMQSCKECEKFINSGILLSYEPLVKSEDGSSHKRELCAKCRLHEICHEADTFYGRYH